MGKIKLYSVEWMKKPSNIQFVRNVKAPQQLIKYKRPFKPLMSEISALTKDFTTVFQ